MSPVDAHQVARAPSRKRGARAEIARRIARLTPAQRAEKSGRALELLKGLPELEAARTLMLFASMPDELDTSPIIRHALGAGLRLVLPRCDTARRTMHRVLVRRLEDMAPGAYGILEPAAGPEVPVAELDLVLVPARAFDERGNRLGRGAGYYDRLLSDPSLHATLCGIAFEEQVLADVPSEAHDRPVQVIVTDARVRRPG